MYILVDCNNFFASCERIFRPDLNHTPIIVLSGNDGCVVARSAEAKKLGIPMGAPVHTLQTQIKEHHIVSFSSNFALYADISHRIMTILQEWCPYVEIYSIDEAFLNLTHYNPNLKSDLTLTQWGLKLRHYIKQCTGITVSLGIAPTKTLAKLAAEHAKKTPDTQGVYSLEPPSSPIPLLYKRPIRDIWGIGKKWEEKLHRIGCTTADQLTQLSSEKLRQLGGTPLEATSLELQGIPCYIKQPDNAPQQQMLYSRTFGEVITDFSTMRQALNRYCENITTKLRQKHLYTSALSVFIHTGYYQPEGQLYTNQLTHTFPATQDSRYIRAIANTLLQYIWKDGYKYKKAGIILGNLTSCPTPQLPLQYDTSPDNLSLPSHPSPEQETKTARLMKSLDLLNKGKKRIWFASEGMHRATETAPSTDTPKGWDITQRKLSPAYTTKWTDIPRVK